MTTTNLTSPDGRFVWDVQRWLPAGLAPPASIMSPDGRFTWSGHQWQPLARIPAQQQPLIYRSLAAGPQPSVNWRVAAAVVTAAVVFFSLAGVGLDRYIAHKDNCEQLYSQPLDGGSYPDQETLQSVGC